MSNLTNPVASARTSTGSAPLLPAGPCRVIEFTRLGACDQGNRHDGQPHASLEVDLSELQLVRHTLAAHLPFGDGEFDFAICDHALQDLDDPISACREMARIAKAGVIIGSLDPQANLDGQARWQMIDGGNELLLLEEQGRAGATCDTIPAALQFEDPRPAPAQTPTAGDRMANSAFDLVYSWSGTLQCRTITAAAP
jgi:SAM-dependent methyltransferase